MIFFAVSIVVQILCIMHVINTGRDRIWIWVIILLSGLGCCAYFAFQIMPDLFGPGSRHARKAYAKRENNPVRKLKLAEERLALVDTAANRVDLGDAYHAMGAFGEAADQYRRALDHLSGRDAKIETKLGWALFEGGEFKQALSTIERIPRPSSIGEADRLDLLRARILTELGRSGEAVTLYEDIVTRLPGEEARCRYSALLLEMGKTAEARTHLEMVEQRIKYASEARDPGDRAMIDWAMQQLRSLRNATA